MYSAKIVAQSKNAFTGTNLTTFVLKYPRYIHAELMTHRVFSRNASSSRAIPVKKLVKRSLAEMVKPIRWGLNQPGMQANEQDLSGIKLFLAKTIWSTMAYINGWGAIALSNLGLHKQWANRPTEWFGHIEVIVSSTEWQNFFELRDHPDAQPEIRQLAKLMKYEFDNTNCPLVVRGAGIGDSEDNWHLPFVTDEERAKYDTQTLRAMSTARCARVSYLTHDGLVPSVEKDFKLHEQLVGSVPIHASPTEHVAAVIVPFENEDVWSGNFRNWRQYRKMIESDYGLVKI